tara:strand:+ start:226 stop:870 length:645 start_codon:yes stop_codon:yes gene_type:complete
MKNKNKLPEVIPVFPLSNFIMFPHTTVPLNIFEPRYIQMIDDCMTNDRMLGMIQPKKTGSLESPDLYNIGCMGKITSFNETSDGRYLIVLNGISRFKILSENKSEKLYRICKIDLDDFENDLVEHNKEIKFKDLEIIFKNLKSLFEKQGYAINWKDLEKQTLDQVINTLSMASPFSLEEKQILLESFDLKDRQNKLEQILKTYVLDKFSNSTIQ